MSIEDQERSGTSAGGGRRLAIVVGVNGKPTLARILQQGCCGFTLFHLPLLGEQATTSLVRDAVLDLANHLQEDDFALFFFSGHAEAMPIGADLDDVYLVTHDFNEARAKRDKDAYLSLRGYASNSLNTKKQAISCSFSIAAMQASLLIARLIFILIPSISV